LKTATRAITETTIARNCRALRNCRVRGLVCCLEEDIPFVVIFASMLFSICRVSASVLRIIIIRLRLPYSRCYSIYRADNFRHSHARGLRERYSKPSSLRCSGASYVTKQHSSLEHHLPQGRGAGGGGGGRRGSSGAYLSLAAATATDVLMSRAHNSRPMTSGRHPGRIWPARTYLNVGSARNHHSTTARSPTDAG